MNFDPDIRSFFDTVDQELAIRLVRTVVGDRRIVRLIRKWLKAAVLEDGIVTVSKPVQQAQCAGLSEGFSGVTAPTIWPSAAH